MLSASRIKLLLAVLAALTLVAGGCGGGAPAPAGDGGAVEQTVELSSFAFSPSDFTFQQGQEVKLTLVSTDIEHTFTVPDLGVDFAIGAGETKTVTFTPNQAGSFDLTCTVPGHAEAGMVGTVTVQ